MGTYSFVDIEAAITGPGGSFSIAEGGVADEGITVSMAEDKDTMTVGADGAGMHSLHAGKSGTITVRCLKTNPVNKQLQDLYNYQTSSSANHGRNTLTIRDTVRGDNVTAREAAFRKQPDNSFSKDGAVQEWGFNCVYIDQILGSGSPEV